MYDDRPTDGSARISRVPTANAPAIERRNAADQVQDLREGLTPAQLVTIESMEAFRWTLTFVRRPMFRDPLPVLFDRNDSRFVVIGGDGSVDETPTLKLRG